jgi:hypothetical protein
MLFHQLQRVGIDHPVHISVALFYKPQYDVLQHQCQLQNPSHQEALISYKV